MSSFLFLIFLFFSYAVAVNWYFPQGKEVVYFKESHTLQVDLTPLSGAVQVTLNCSNHIQDLGSVTITDTLSLSFALDFSTDADCYFRIGTSSDDIISPTFFFRFGGIEFTSPQPLDAFRRGTIIPIIWTTKGIHDQISLLYSSHDTPYFSPIYSGPNFNSFQWDSPPLLATNSSYVIKASVDLRSFESASFSVIGASLQFTSPLQEDVWYTCMDNAVSWTIQGVIERVSIYYTTDLINLNTIVLGLNTSKKSSGKFDWNIPSIIPDSAVNIVLKNSDDLDESFISPSFKIESGSIVISSPTKGSKFRRGDVIVIEYSTVGFHPLLDFYYTPSLGSKILIASKISNSGKYLWKTDRLMTTTDLKISINNDRISTISDLFSITGAEVNVILPGMSFIQGERVLISWSMIGNVKQFNIILTCIDSVEADKMIATGVDALSKGHNWIVPATLTGKFMIVLQNSELVDEQFSSKIFTISIGAFDIVRPNSDDVLVPSIPFNIEWKLRGCFETISIRYDCRDGQAWSIIASSVKNSGQYLWTPTSAQYGSQCTIRISTELEPKPHADSSFFVISLYPLQLMKPEAYRLFAWSELISIEWNNLAPNLIENLDIKLKYENEQGQKSVNLIDNHPTNTPYSFIVTSKHGYGKGIITISSSISSQISTESHVFYYYKQVVLITNPQSGNNLYTSEKCTITWTSPALTSHSLNVWIVDGQGISTELIGVDFGANSFSFIMPEVKPGMYFIRLEKSVDHTIGGISKFFRVSSSFISFSNTISPYLLFPGSYFTIFLFTFN
ncbi:hypothetical protein RCL1_008876 [Eukaryota sp. TZLM3-RCL]